jgi:hypothetical protein
MRWFFHVACTLAILALQEATAAEPPPETFEDVAKQVRVAMAHRDYEGSDKAIGRLEAIAATAEDKDKIVAERLKAIELRLKAFWDAVHDGCKTLKGTEELEIGDALVAVIEYDAVARQLAVKVRGQTKRYTSGDMPVSLAVAMSHRAIRKGSVASDERVGTLYAMDAKGDRTLARQHWTAAERGGVDVKSLLPELDTPLPGAALVKVPKVTSAAAAVLDPRQWVLQVADGDGWRRLPVGDHGVVNAKRQLEITAPEEGETVWLTHSQKLPANFAFRFYFLSLPHGQACGLFTGSRGEATATAAVVQLPPDTIEIELIRRTGKLTCRVNGEELPFEITDDKAARSQGVFGISLPPGSRVTVAGFEVVPRGK